MFALRFLGVFVLALCAFAGAFLLAYAAILCGWIVYADYSGTLGGADGIASAVAFRWAPVGGVLAGLVCAASLLRLGMRNKVPATPRQPEATAAGTASLPDADIDARLAEHGALLRELQAMTRSHALTLVEPSNTGRSSSGHNGPAERRVA